MQSLYPSLDNFKYESIRNSDNPSSEMKGRQLRHVVVQRGTNEGGFDNYATKNDAGIYPAECSDTEACPYKVGAICSRTPSISATKKSSHTEGQAYEMHASGTVRTVITRKNSNGKVGLRLGAIQGGVFVLQVDSTSPVSVAGLKIGDQILKINDIPVAGYSMQNVSELIRKAPLNEVTFSFMCRPLEKTLTLQKDQNGVAGFAFDMQGRITKIKKDSSAARNGLLIDHSITEVCGQNVIGLKYSKIRAIIDNCGDTVVLNIMPTKLFDLMIKPNNHKPLIVGLSHPPEPASL